MYLVSRAILQGRRAGLISLTDVGTGFLVDLGAVSVGIGAVIMVVSGMFTAEVRWC
jgi:threonine/homoserine/homoserine lactone efflux protein